VLLGVRNVMSRGGRSIQCSTGMARLGWTTTICPDRRWM
jgi:hypothetical protein